MKNYKIPLKSPPWSSACCTWISRGFSYKRKSTVNPHEYWDFRCFSLELLTRFELVTSSLPRTCSAY